MIQQGRESTEMVFVYLATIVQSMNVRSSAKTYRDPAIPLRFTSWAVS